VTRQRGLTVAEALAKNLDEVETDRSLRIELRI
jgi:hypothetical protein